MSGIEQQKSENLIRQRTDMVPQVLSGQFRAFEHRATAAEALGDERRCSAEELVR